MSKQAEAPSVHVSETPQRSRRRIVPNIPAIENFLKRGLGGEFARGLKERDEKRAAQISPAPLISLSDKFEAMLLADTNAREAKSQASR